MSSGPVLHHVARGIHPAAFVGAVAPFRWTGPWDSGHTYAVKDVVTDASTAYLCLLAHSNHEPPSASYWALFDIQDHVLWVDTSSGPPYALRMWDAASHAWRDVGSTGDSVSADCLRWPHGAQLCNPSTDVVTLHTPSGAFSWDASGLTLPGGHRLEVV